MKWFKYGLFVCFLTVLLPALAQAAQLTLTWQDMSTNETGFHIQRKVELCTGPSAFLDLVNAAQDAVTYVDTTVQEGNGYCYRLNAFNTAGSSAWSNTAGAVVPYTSASTPNPLTLTGNTLGWTDKTPNDAGFLVERKTGTCASVGTFGLISTTVPHATSFADSLVVEGATYCYRVAATNALSTSPYTNTVERVIPLTIPVAPAQLGVTLGP